MWIVARLLIAAGAFVARYLRRLVPLTAAGEVDGVPYFVKIRKTKGRVTGFRIGVHHRVPVIFRLSAEQRSDRFFKTIGLATEFQTGDSGFDQNVYIACDHYALLHVLKASKEARAAIWDALTAGFDRITADGEVLWIERKASREPTAAEHELAAKLGKALSGLDARARFFSDPMLGRAMAVEALTWSIFAYALSSFLEAGINREDYHLRPMDLALPGLLTAGLLFAFLFGLIVLFLRRSSRGHRLLIEAGLLLALALPVTGIQAVSDINRSLDQSEATVVSSSIERAERRRHRGRRGRTYYSYHLHLAPTHAAVPVPREIETSYDVFNLAQARPRGVAELHIGHGRLGYPWYRRIVIR